MRRKLLRAAWRVVVGLFALMGVSASAWWLAGTYLQDWPEPCAWAVAVDDACVSPGGFGANAGLVEHSAVLFCR